MKVLRIFFVGVLVAMVVRGDEPEVSDKATASGEDAPVVLPALETLGERSWNQAEIPGLRFLSLASRRETKDCMQSFLDYQEFFHRLVPEIKRPESGTGFTVVLKSPVYGMFVDARGYKPQERGTVVRQNGGLQIKSVRKADQGDSLHRFGDIQIEVYPDLPPSSTSITFTRSGPIDLSAEDTTEHVRAAEDQWAETLYNGYRKRMLDMHPELPVWYRVGLDGSNIRLYLTSGSVDVFSNPDFAIKHGRSRGAFGEKKRELVLWPLARFFATTHPSIAVRTMQKNAEEREVFHDQSVLFLFWGLRGGGERQRLAFRRFIAAACERPVTEELFQGCFGFGYEEAQRRFEKFARSELAAEGSSSRRVVSGNMDFLLSEKVRRRKPEKIEVRPALSTEVIGIMGEVYLWSAARFRDENCRSIRQGDYTMLLSAREPGKRWSEPTTRGYFRQLWSVDRISPAQMAMLEKARNVMGRDVGSDPESKVVLGFIEIAKGNNTEAKRWLREATAARVQRPDAYLELARLLLEEALEAQKGGEGGPSCEQVGPVLDLIHEALKQSPEMWLGYHMLAYGWGCSGAVPPSEELALLVRAAHLYPEDVYMTREVASLCVRAGRPRDAVALAQLGLAWFHGNRKGSMLVADLNRLKASAEEERAIRQPGHADGQPRN